MDFHGAVWKKGGGMIRKLSPSVPVLDWTRERRDFKKVRSNE
ncbi:MAG: hypothetical protein ABRQ23_05805 [Syntrophomonadaceae bacterium]